MKTKLTFFSLQQRTGISIEADFSESENLLFSSDPGEMQIDLDLKSGKKEVSYLFASSSSW